MSSKTLTVTWSGTLDGTTDNVLDLIGVIPGVTSHSSDTPYGSGSSYLVGTVVYESTTVNVNTLVELLSLANATIVDITNV